MKPSPADLLHALAAEARRPFAERRGASFAADFPLSDGLIARVHVEVRSASENVDTYRLAAGKLIEAEPWRAGRCPCDTRRRERGRLRVGCSNRVVGAVVWEVRPGEVGYLFACSTHLRKPPRDPACVLATFRMPGAFLRAQLEAYDRRSAERYTREHIGERAADAVAHALAAAARWQAPRPALRLVR